MTETNMAREEAAGRLHLLAPAKVNLHLEVQGKREDGYHELRMFLVPVSLWDELRLCRLEEPGRVEVAVEDAPDVAAGEENLCHRAARYYFRCTGVSGGTRVRLRKRIPAGAGLGGGSSDAAATIRGLERLWGVSLTAEQRRGSAFAVGADVPFFFAGGAAWVGGIGEKVEAVEAFPAQWLVLIYPGVFLSTAEVFSGFNPGLTSAGQPPTITQFNFRGFVEGLRNDLQQSAVTLEPAISSALLALGEAGVAGRMMSGSGSAVFGLLPDRARAEDAAETVKRRPEAKAWHVEVVHTLPPGSFPIAAI